MEFVDYYKVLGVKRNAPPEEISKAYKRLARTYHPDLNKAGDAESKFKQVNEAYEVLKDPEKRKRYDLLGSNWKHGAPFEPPPDFRNGGAQWDVRGAPGGFGGADFSDFFETLFGGRPRRGRRGPRLEDLFGGGGGEEVPEARPGQDIESTVTVELEDAFHGAKRSIELTGPTGRKRYEVKIPKGIRDGERIRLAGQGLGGGRETRGDLYLTIKIAPHERFRVEGDDLVVETPVDAWDAALGGKVAVSTLDGEVQMSLPAGQASGVRLRLRGKGLPKRDGTHGDLYAQIKIVVPRSLSDEQRRLFEKLRDQAAKQRA
ncbi:MAG: J domain-containing protein [Deltaproteobacteria bacterium]|nr:J domain-containing protein [Deltaproteobacteria bacterium]